MGDWSSGTLGVRTSEDRLAADAQRTVSSLSLTPVSAIYSVNSWEKVDWEVLWNVTIQRTADGLKEIGRYYIGQRYQEALGTAYHLEQDLCRVMRLTNEDQMVKAADLMRKYADTLAPWVNYK